MEGNITDVQANANSRLQVFHYWGDGGGFALQYLMQFYMRTLHNLMWICRLKTMWASPGTVH